MRKNKLLSIVLLAAMVISVGCSNNSPSESGNSGTSQSSGAVLSLEGIAQNEITADISVDVTANDTTFKLNRVINSGKTDDNGNPYIYFDVTISNLTSSDYELSVLNNFYILLDNGNEVHFDIKTQIYASNNIVNYYSSPFAVPANSQFSGIVGGFVIPKDTQEFTLGFFPTQDNKSDKSNVIKISVSTQNMDSLN